MPETKAPARAADASSKAVEDGNRLAEALLANERVLRKAILWLEADAEARTRQSSFGNQTLVVVWSGGRIETIHIDQRNTIRPDRPGLAPELPERNP